MTREAWVQQLHDMMAIQPVRLHVQGMASDVAVELAVQNAPPSWEVIGKVQGAASLDAAMTTIFARLDGEDTP
jgi:hypothetical protein